MVSGRFFDRGSKAAFFKLTLTGRPEIIKGGLLLISTDMGWYLAMNYSSFL